MGVSSCNIGTYSYFYLALAKNVVIHVDSISIVWIMVILLLSTIIITLEIQFTVARPVFVEQAIDVTLKLGLCLCVV